MPRPFTTIIDLPAGPPPEVLQQIDVAWSGLASSPPQPRAPLRGRRRARHCLGRPAYMPTVPWSSDSRRPRHWRSHAVTRCHPSPSRPEDPPDGLGRAAGALVAPAAPPSLFTARRVRRYGAPMRPIPASRLGDAHGLLRAINERERLRARRVRHRVHVDELFPPGLENALGRTRQFVSFARAAGLLNEDRGTVELTDMGKRYVRAGDAEQPFEVVARAGRVAAAAAARAAHDGLDLPRRRGRR